MYSHSGVYQVIFEFLMIIDLDTYSQVAGRDLNIQTGSFNAII